MLKRGKQGAGPLNFWKRAGFRGKTFWGEPELSAHERIATVGVRKSATSGRNAGNRSI